VPEAGTDPDYATIADRAAAHRLEIFGAFHPISEDGAPKGTATLLLLGPAEPGFWAHVTGEPNSPTPAPIRSTAGRAA
jgi:hypothetical protein